MQRETNGALSRLRLAPSSEADERKQRMRQLANVCIELFLEQSTIAKLPVADTEVA